MKCRVSLQIKGISFLIGILFLVSGLQASEENDKVIKVVQGQFEELNHRIDVLEKAIDDVLWYNKVGDIAYVDKVRHVGPPPSNVPNPTLKGAKNPLRFYSYIFIPKIIDIDKKYPLLVFPHGGVHANFSTYFTHIVRELIAQGYVIIAPDYRGSTGYGRDMYESIDYGGLEIDDVHEARNYMLENYEFIDKTRVGIIGWSHGGMIALMDIFKYPNEYQVAFAGVPVSDLVARMGYSTESYRDLYSAPYHLGKTAHENVDEYVKRSPAWNAEKLKTPLLIHTNTSDEDVFVIEVQHLIKALKAEGKKFEYKIFDNAPGGHSFDRLDTLFAKNIRMEIYNFINRHLNPPTPFKSVKELSKAGYPGYPGSK